MQFTDAVTVEGKPRRTADGYLIATAKCVRTGIQIYTGDEVGKPEMDRVRVYRSPEEVSPRTRSRASATRPSQSTIPRSPSPPTTSRNSA